ncbi:hypothetical protein D3C77_395580 [compost metagenome]
MLVDLEALFLGQGAAADAEVVQLAEVVGLGRQAHVEAPAVTRIVLVHRRLALAPGHQVIDTVGEQPLFGRQGRHRHLCQALGLVAGQAQAVVEMP